MKTLNAAAVMRLFIILALAVHMAPGVRSGNKASEAPEQDNKDSMGVYDNSIDDEFRTCKKEMYELVIDKKLLENELNLNEKFKNAWTEAKTHLKQDSTSTDSLRKVALCAYTTTHIYRELNTKMRTDKGSYTTGFGLISLHFLMMDAIQARNPDATCRTTYRRTPLRFTNIEKFVRFGSFASSTCNPYSPKFLTYGKETCFVISTCHGAPISDLSVAPDEDEVLIPPYELFESEKLEHLYELGDCKVVYKLTSKGKKSNMDCEYVKQKKTGKTPG